MLDALFNELDNLITLRKRCIEEHFGNQFLEEYIRADERIWYKQNISKIDRQIVAIANKIAPYLSLTKKYAKVADVFRDEKFSDWYNKTKIEKNKNKGVCK